MEVLSPFLDDHATGPIIDAINATLGDVKNQPKRYDRATLEAVKHDTAIITPQTKALRRDVERREALKALLECIDLSRAVSEMKTELTSIFGVSEASFAETEAYFGEALTVDNLFPFVYKVMEDVTNERAASILREYANKYEFRYNSKIDPQKELEQFLDTRINAFLVRKLIEGLSGAVEKGTITEQSCHTITEHLLTNNASPTGTNALYISLLEEQIRRIQSAHGGANQPIVYFTIGCGDGSSDVKVCEELHKRIQDLKLLVVGFDPFVSDLDHNFVINQLGGKIVNHPIPPDETFLDVIEQKLGSRHYPVIATDRYALHHMGYSLAEVSRKLQGIPLVSVEEPITLIQRTHFFYRLTKIGWDLLANYAFEVRFGGSWISEARSNPDVFGVLYRRSEELEEESGRGAIRMQKVGANPLRQNCIIVYYF
ncbi:MAG TPA: hypothetical protein VFV38_23410 [Ktedonobacteraceae bacterium]|nr:hypothetical protein [Ktedonobacteraceae bacterium]